MYYSFSVLQKMIYFYLDLVQKRGNNTVLVRKTGGYYLAVLVIKKIPAFKNGSVAVSFELLI